MAKLWKFWQGHPKPAFSKKRAKGGPREIFQKSPKKQPSFERPKSTLAQMALSSNSMHLICKDWTRFRSKQRLQKFLKSQVIATFARSLKTRIFRKKAKRRPREIFQKSSKKQTSFERPKSTLAQMTLSCNQYALKGQRLEKILRQKSGSKSARMTKLRHFWQGHPKPAFCKKVQRGDQRKFFKNRKESFPRLKGPTALQRKRHYTLISMQLQGKDWKRFWGKKAAPKVPEWPSYGTFCKVTQNPYFIKKAKGGPWEIFQKSPKKQPSFETRKSTLAQMALSYNQYALKGQRLEKILGQ